MKTVAVSAAVIGIAIVVCVAGIVVTTEDAQVVFGSNNKMGNHNQLTVRTNRSNAYIKLELASLPDDTIGLDIEKATLRLWVSEVRKEGSFDVVEVLEDWSEDTVDGSHLPLLGATVLHDVPMTFPMSSLATRKIPVSTAL